MLWTDLQGGAQFHKGGTIVVEESRELEIGNWPKDAFDLPSNFAATSDVE